MLWLMTEKGNLVNLAHAFSVDLIPLSGKDSYQVVVFSGYSGEYAGSRASVISGTKALCERAMLEIASAIENKQSGVLSITLEELEARRRQICNLCGKPQGGRPGANHRECEDEANHGDEMRSDVLTHLTAPAVEIDRIPMSAFRDEEHDDVKANHFE